MIIIEKDEDNNNEIVIYQSVDNVGLVVSNNYDRVKVSKRQLLKLISALEKCKELIIKESLKK